MTHAKPRPTPSNLPQADSGQSIPASSARRLKISLASAGAFEPDDGQVLPVGLECQHEFDPGAARPRNFARAAIRRPVLAAPDRVVAGIVRLCG
jgi:hypothetical protein